MEKFSESKLEQAFIEFLQNEGYPHFQVNTISRAEDEVLIEEDLKQYLQNRYAKDNITENEIQSIVSASPNFSHLKLELGRSA